MMSSAKPDRHHRMEENLAFLGLKRIGEIYPDHAKAAEKEGAPYEAFLDRLLAEEAAAKFERLVKNRIAQARFPTIKTLDSFDFTHPKKIDRAQIQRLFTLDFVEERANCIFIANHGLGKTHLALALGYEACLRGITTRFVTAMDAINELTAAMANGRFLTALKRFTRPCVVVLDELGYLPVSSEGVELLFQIITTRYETGSIILTTNRPFKQWGKLFGNDNTLAAAVVDRLVHHAEIVVIEGESYRMKREG
jgi:DNA replication protein DnaC